MSENGKVKVVNFRALASAGLVVLVCSLSVWSVVTGRISGTVKDPTGAVIPSAQITALETQTGIKYSTTTSGQGSYSFPSLPVGHYDLDVKASGFREILGRRVSFLTLTRP